MTLPTPSESARMGKAHAEQLHPAAREAASSSGQPSPHDVMVGDWGTALCTYPASYTLSVRQ